jgi:hypothetical protein
MTGDTGFGYQTRPGDYAIDGFLWEFRDGAGACSFAPERLIGDPKTDGDGNLVVLRTCIQSRETSEAESVVFNTRAIFFLGALHQFHSDLGDLIRGESSSLRFPSHNPVGFRTAAYQLSVTVGRKCESVANVVFRCISPEWWDGLSVPESPGSDERITAVSFSLAFTVDVSSLIECKDRLSSFLAWLSRGGLA